ncbi:MAG: hypothetical protein ACE5HE_11685 [Phycisphaerae bacterium]
MTGKVKAALLESDLSRLLTPGFPGITVEVGQSKRWNRPCVTFRWAGFDGLLPEERFHRLNRVIPESLRTKRLDGFVWLELTPQETIEEFLELPRSEDIAERERDIYCRLLELGFFESLSAALGESPEATCRGDFSRSAALLGAANWTAKQIRDAKLVFIHHGTYCDCQALLSAASVLGDLHARAV